MSSDTAGFGAPSSTGPLRYFYISLFIPAMVIPLTLVEWLLRASGSGLSLFDTRGVGQVAFLLLIILMVLAFSRFVAGENALTFASPYARQWKRGLAGFATFYFAVTAIIVAAYMVFGIMGAVGWSAEGLAEFSLKTVERTLVGLLVVVVLALTEESLFRVFLMRYLRWNTTPIVTIAAVLFSSAVFAISHVIADPKALEPALLTGLFILGVLLCVTYLSTGSFLCAVGVHVGLLGSKVFLRKTKLLEIDPSAVMLSDSVDLRMSPIVWALFAGLALVIFLMRHRLTARFAIERPVIGPA